MKFVTDGVSTRTNVSYPNDANLRPGTGAFTVEWFQYYNYESTTREFAYIFSLGDGISVGFLNAIGGKRYMYLLIPGNTNFTEVTLSTTNWQHIAVVGNGGANGSRNIKIYIDGGVILTTTLDYDITSANTLYIGNDASNDVNNNYAGLLANFRWVKGTAVYSAPFTPPAVALTAIPGTELLLLASSQDGVVADSSSRGRTATNNGVVYNALSPFP